MKMRGEKEPFPFPPPLVFTDRGRGRGAVASAEVAKGAEEERPAGGEDNVDVAVTHPYTSMM